MAITVGTVMPMTVYNTSSGSGTNIPMSFPVTSAKPFTAGDVVVMVSGTGTVLDGNTQQAVLTIVGIAAEPKASVATAGDNDQLLVFPAFPGTMFIGNMVGGAAADYGGTSSTPAFTDVVYLSSGTALYDTVELTVGGFAAINHTDVTSGLVKAYAFAREQMQGKPYVTGVSATVLGTLNPRTIFNFKSTIFTAA